MGMGVMRKNKSKTVNIEKRVEEITRRIDKASIDLYSSDSEYALRQIPELKKRLDNLFNIIAMNDNEFRIFRDAVFAIQQEIYRKK